MPQRFVVVFDLDDTLVLERTYIESGFHAVAHAVAERANFAAPEVQQLLTTMFDAGIRGDTFDRLLETLAIPESVLTVAELVDAYRRHRPSIGMSAETISMLSRLRAAPGIGLGLITDGPRLAQRAKIEALGVDTLVDAIVVTSELPSGQSKPHPAAFRQMCERWPYLEPGSFAYVADNPAKDFVAPNELGWHTVQVRWPGQLYGEHVSTDDCGVPDTVITSWSALIPSLDLGGLVDTE